MIKKHIQIIIFLLITLTYFGCDNRYYELLTEKNTRTTSPKEILSFNLLEGDNSGVIPTDITGIVNADSVNLTVPPGTDISSLSPSITLSGDSINPPGGAEVDFSGGPVFYTVTARDSTTKQYTVTVTIASSSDADLSGITISEGTLSPVFLPTITSYYVNVSNSVTEIAVDGTANHVFATVSNNPVNIVSLSVGENVVTLTCTAEDGITTKDYTVTVTRDESSDADLSSITLSEGTLSPAFAPGTTLYSVSVANDVTGITVTGTANHGFATVDNNPVNPVSLSVGANVVTVTCTAEDGITIKNYTITVNRDDLVVSTSWPKRLGGVGDDRGNSIITDYSGNVIVGGQVLEDADFGGGVDSSNYGGIDAFVSKFDYNGACQWSKRLGGADTDRVIGVATDSVGNIIVTGYVNGNAELDGDVNTSVEGETALGVGPGDEQSDDIFISKFTSDGIYIWSKRLEGSSNALDRALAVAIDSSNNIIVVGFVHGKVDLNGDNKIKESGENDSGYGVMDGIIIKYNSDGGYEWAKRLGGINSDTVKSVAVDFSDNIIVTGFVEGNADLNGDGDADDEGGEDATNYGVYDAFISKFDSNGNFQWSKRLGKIYSDQGKGITSDASGNVIVTGQVYGDADLNGNGNSTDENETARTDEGVSEDIFICKFSPDGTHQWSKRLGGASGDYGESVTTDSLGNITVTGNVSGNADLNGNGVSTDGGAEDFSIYGGSDIFISQFDPLGDHRWSKRLGKTDGDVGYSITTNLYDEILITGSVRGEADLTGDGDFVDGGEDATGFLLSDIFISKFTKDGAGQDVMKDILTFDFLVSDNSFYLSEDVLGTVNDTTVTVVVPNGTDITDLIPDIKINGASVNPDSGDPTDFTNPVLYTVTAEDSSEKVYTVTVIVSGPELVSITVSPSDQTIDKNLVSQLQYTATGTYIDSSTVDLTDSVTWSSSETSVATISNSAGTEGLATLVEEGGTTITATLDVISGTTSLTVTVP